jgi:hypothetical protein
MRDKTKHFDQHRKQAHMLMFLQNTFASSYNHLPRKAQKFAKKILTDSECFSLTLHIREVEIRLVGPFLYK